MGCDPQNNDHGAIFKGSGLTIQKSIEKHKTVENQQCQNLVEEKAALFSYQTKFSICLYCKVHKRIVCCRALLLLPNASKLSKHIWENDFSCSPNPKPINHRATTTQNRMDYSTHKHSFACKWFSSLMKR